LNLPQGEYLGDLYVYGFDEPEAHVIQRHDVLHYGFYVEPWGQTYEGQVELRGLDDMMYQVMDTVSGASLGTVQGPTAVMQVTFTNSLLVHALPQ
jgi:alpha-galactosidase